MNQVTDEFSGLDLIGETASPSEAMMSIYAVHTEPPIAQFASGECFSGGPVTADVRRMVDLGIYEDRNLRSLGYNAFRKGRLRFWRAASQFRDSLN